MMKGFIHPNGSYYEAAKNVVDGAVEVPLRPSLHHLWQNVAWTLDETAALADAQKKTREAIITSRNATITSGFTYLGKPIDSDRDSVMAITGAGVAALAAKAARIPYSVTWTCADDSTLVLDADGVLGMVVQLALFADSQHARARPLKAAIKNAKTPADVAKVTW